MRYMVWNNKGGVGKTFLTFVLATEYAKRNPGKSVVVIDVCPQANISEILLGGNGKGALALEGILNQENRKTLGGYFDKRISMPDSKTGDESDHLLNVNKYADSLPNNLWLVCGDPSLELQVQSINQAASQDLPEGRWRNVHHWLKDIQDGVKSKFNNRDITFFLDCNPSFATYTAQAIVASDKLIVPCTADGSSARAINNIGKLIYGVDVPVVYEKRSFKFKADENQIILPELFLVALNRATTSSKKPARAFKAMYEKIRENIMNLLTKNVLVFSSPDQDLFFKEHFIDMPDAHTVAIVASHFAIPVSSLTAKTYHLGKNEDSDGIATKINTEPLNNYIDAIDRIIAKI